MVRYEKYKDSGIAWIGEIPEHWRFCRIKRLGRVLTGTTPSTSIDRYFDREDINWYTPTDFSDENIYLNNSNRHLSQTVLDEKIVQLYPPKCVLLIGIGGTLGRVGYSVDKCYSNQQINVIVFNSGVIPLYYAYSLQPIKAYIWSNANTATMPILNQSATKNLFVAIPPTTEQEQIAKYLGWKCGEVDRIIEVRERQIKLLAKLRTSVISRAVTRGLNPNAPLKDSGIDWIGQIPEHWDYKRIKFCVSKSFAGVWGDDASGNNNDVRCYRVADFDYEKLSLSDKNPTDRNVDKNTFIQREVKYNDILIEKSGGGDITPVGRAILVNLQTKAICSNFVHCVKVHSNTHNKFLLYTLHSMYSKRINLLHFNQTTGIQNLKVAEYLSNVIYLPNFGEQQQIADYLDKKTAEIDSTIDKFKVQIDKLKEYRQALITEVVTGKIDVRGIEIPTPKSN